MPRSAPASADCKAQLFPVAREQDNNYQTGNASAFCRGLWPPAEIGVHRAGRTRFHVVNADCGQFLHRFF